MGKLFPYIPISGVVVLALVAASRGSGVAAAGPQTAVGRQAELRGEVQQRLQELDSPCYETRCQAAQRLEHWLDMPEMATLLAEQFQRLAVQPELPFEVRWRILMWRTRLPLAASEPPPAVPVEELERLVRQLDDDSYSVRAGASERLQWMAASDPLAKPIMLILKRCLAEPSLSEETYRRLESIRNIAWGRWLTSDAPDWNLPPVSNAQIDSWLDELGQPATKHDLRAAMRRRIARQQLLDALSQDCDVPRVKAAIAGPSARQVGPRGRGWAEGALGADAARLGGGVLERPQAPDAGAAPGGGTADAGPRRRASQLFRSRRRPLGPLRERQCPDAGRLSGGRCLLPAQLARRGAGGRLPPRQSAHAAAADRLFLLRENGPRRPPGKAQPPHARPFPLGKEAAERLRIGNARPTRRPRGLALRQPLLPGHGRRHGRGRTRSGGLDQPRPPGQPEQSLRGDLRQLAVDGTREAAPGLLEAIRRRRNF